LVGACSFDSMVKSLLLTAVGSVAAEQGCVGETNWCSVTRHAVELSSKFGPVSFSDCILLCSMRDTFDCHGVSFEAADSPKGVCTHHRFDKNGSLSDVFAYFPIVDLAKVLPNNSYTYRQLGESKPVAGVEQCRDELRASSGEAMFANFGNHACKDEQPTPTATIIDAARVEMEVILNFLYTPPAEELGYAPAGYLTLVNTGFQLKESHSLASDWTWSFGGVRPSETNKENVCLSAQNFLTPVYLNNKEYSSCACGMRSGSPDSSSMFGWVMQNATKGPMKCMGNVTKGGKYDLIAIEDPIFPFHNKTELCNTGWQVKSTYIVKNNPRVLSRQCAVGAFDGAWVDGPLYMPGDFSREWFDTLTISSRDNQLNAHTKEGDSNIPFRVSIDGCLITLYLKKGCDDCIATGRLSVGGEKINWETGLNDGDYWMRKNPGCCTLFDASPKESSSSLVSPTRNHVAENTSTRISRQCETGGFDGAWVDGQLYPPGDFSIKWFDSLTISLADNQLNAHTKDGGSNIPFPVSIDGCLITVYL